MPLKERIIMGFSDFLNNPPKILTPPSNVSSSDFPVGTIIDLTTTDGDPSMTFTMPNKTKYTVTHDNIKSAEVLAMGVITIATDKPVYGTKYKIVMTDGKTAILSVPSARTQSIEHIIF